MRHSLFRLLVGVIVAGGYALVVSSSMAQAAPPGDDDLTWGLHGRNFGEERFSPLMQINEETLPNLRLAWSFKIDVQRGLEATPIVVGGVMYVVGPYSIVYALDAKSGIELWRFDAHIDRTRSNRGCCDAVSRGVAVLNDRVYLAAYDGRLIALNRANGRLVWSVDTVADHSRNYTITGAPRIAGDLIVIGNAGGEYGVRGYVTAYDAGTGKQAWRFYTVPGDPRQPPENDAMKLARDTWFGSAYATYGGGGTVWDSMAYDPQLNLFYIGVDNGSVWSRKFRSEDKGDNLFLASIVALDARTGRYVWHYQTVPGEEWDFSATQHMILTDLVIQGATRKVLMQASKNGFFYVIDRTNGQFISANNFVPQNWTTGFDPTTGRPKVNDDLVRYSDGRLRQVTPSVLGGHNWQPMSYDPLTHLVYIPAMLNSWFFQALNEAVMPTKPGTFNTGAMFAMGSPNRTGDRTLPTAADVPDLTRDADLAKLRASWQGQLIAWDPVMQNAVWIRKLPTMYNGGTLSTAGNLVFQGTGTGELIAYRATDGETLWRTPTNTGVLAPPISYQLGDEQFIAVAAGWGGGLATYTGPVASSTHAQANPYILVYSLNGDAALPAPKAPPQPASILAATGTQQQLDEGKLQFLINCAACHGADAIGGGLYPDLRYMSQGTFELFPTIVRGAFAGAGMPNFSDRLSEGQIESIRQYLAERNGDLRAAASTQVAAKLH